MSVAGRKGGAYVLVLLLDGLLSGLLGGSDLLLAFGRGLTLLLLLAARHPPHWMSATRMRPHPRDSRRRKRGYEDRLGSSCG
jgi:hypothetical protein